jgi:hypothetical protein
MSDFALSQDAYQTCVGYVAALEHSQQLFAVGLALVFHGRP